MNFNIVPRQFEGETIQTVNARELHKGLEVSTQFKDWIARRIAEYSFIEGKDFCSFLSESSGGRPSKEYAVSIDMAKELAMVERTPKGRDARQYFIECERRIKQQDTPRQIVAGDSTMERDLRALHIISTSLRVSESSKVGMFAKYCESHAPQLVPALPVYAIDAPIISGGESAASSEPTTTITNIVRPIGMSAAQANVHLEAMGLLEKLERKDSKGLPKYYWSVTEKGLAYGKNITSPNNPRETQPHWYVSKSSEIAEIISKGFV